jgi:hypothetical protein
VNARLLSAGAVLGVFVIALAVRLGQHHAALLYPDGYQYLLMARGIAEHLQPTTILGPGGDEFVPSPDAAVKPLFPLLVAIVHAFGTSWLLAAQLVTAVAAAWAVTATTLLVTRLGGSRIAGLGAAALLLASPSIGFWSGFSGPDPLALALVLSAALAFADRRSTLGGLLTGLAITARPEVAVLALAGAVVSLRSERGRSDLRRAVPPAVLSVVLLYALLRIPIQFSNWSLLWLLPPLLGVAGLVAVVPRKWLPSLSLAGLCVAALAVVDRPGPEAVWHDDWPLLVLGAAGTLVLVRGREATAAPALTGAVLLLGSVYLVKNPTLERYFALLLPAAAIVAGLALAELPARGRTVAAATVAVAVGLAVLHPVPGSRDYDMFPTVAKRIAARVDSTPQPLVTAAPDAYGFWLPQRTVRGMRAGARGEILLDATQRLFAPGLGARGRVVARVSDGIAFAGPNLEIDAAPAVLVAGQVIASADRRP